MKTPPPPPPPPPSLTGQPQFLIIGSGPILKVNLFNYFTADMRENISEAKILIIAHSYYSIAIYNTRRG